MIVSDKIVIDLTESMANIGVEIPFKGHYLLQGDLLPYPNATLNEVELDVVVVFHNPEVQVDGNIILHVTGQCDRCLDDIDTTILLPFDQTFYKDIAEDVDDYVYTNSKLDATKAVCDEIVLSLPISLVCKDDCKGLCPKCGVNLNHQTCDCDTTRDNAFSILKNLKF